MGIYLILPKNIILIGKLQMHVRLCHQSESPKHLKCTSGPLVCLIHRIINLKDKKKIED
jgi:hypothetical protein